jgi:Zn-dependent peptidase ImmA (M78 family)/transcriptional regulator with XRE-family HTH domain
MAEKITLNPKILKWARESARMSIEIASAKINVPPSRLESWESGTDKPTLRQAETLARGYKRPFALFFLPDIPRDFKVLQDFRRPDSLPLSTASIFIIREIQQKQAWIHDVYQENGEEILKFIGLFTIKDNPAKVAESILSTIGITPSNYSEANILKEWILKSENKGIFISRTSYIHSKLLLDSKEIQGFSIADPLAPFIFVNSQDWEAPQLFTLVHELAHLWIAETGISNDANLEVEEITNTHPIEFFCNQVAAEVLMPKKIMVSLDEKTFISADEIFKASKKLGVSSFAFLVRAYYLKLISFDKYKKLKVEAEKDFQIFLKKEELRKEKQKEKNGGPSPILLALNRNGRLFTRLVLDSYNNGFVQPSQAYLLLKVKINNFTKLQTSLHN